MNKTDDMKYNDIIVFKWSLCRRDVVGISRDWPRVIIVQSREQKIVGSNPHQGARIREILHCNAVSDLFHYLVGIAIVLIEVKYRQRSSGPSKI
jgi:hypothetical protein